MAAHRQQAMPTVSEPFTIPPVDLLETPQHFLWLMDLPGLSEQRLKVKARQGTLTVVGACQQRGTRGDGFLHGESKKGAFQREFVLGDDLVDIKRATAHLQEGVLSLTLPKQRNGQSQQIPVRELS